MIDVKAGVQFEHVCAMVVMHSVVCSVYEAFGYPVTVTSGSDGAHRPQSLHYSDRALDYRTRHVSVRDRARITEKLKKQLGAGFDVVLEEDHLHVEWDPK